MGFLDNLEAYMDNKDLQILDSSCPNCQCKASGDMDKNSSIS
jgi:hypothetical protein